MLTFDYARPAAAPEAIALAGDDRAASYLGGGTNLVDLMRETIAQPERLIDVTGLSDTIEPRDDGSVVIGAAATNTAVAEHRAVRERFPLLSRAILAGASAQIRNMATAGGNLLQRTRCYYFYDAAARCNKRTPGAGCDAIDGFNRIHAILGGSRDCVATHPSDMAVALAALDARVHVMGPHGPRVVPLTELHRLPGDRPDQDTTLHQGELVTAIELPAAPSTNGTYRKVRDRASYAFALVSVAALLKLADGRIADARLALGGIAPKPWRAEKAEAVLIGAPATAETFRAAAQAELADARPLRDNAFKVPLAERTIVAVLEELAA